jgi:RimJ/RimL family protein N-acetyltransferase
VADLAHWTPPPRPARAVLQGVHVRLEPMDADSHADELHSAFSGHDGLWDYMPYGPFSATEYADWTKTSAMGAEPFFYAILAGEKPQGVASFLNINPAHGTIEVGHICLSPALQHSIAATEAMFLIMSWAFDAGYRRYEWKCNALNLPSRRAAQRLGFSFEGVFRNHMIIKGRNRDSAWFSVIDSDWPALRAAFDRWLSVDNFDAKGQQKLRLSALTKPITRDPAL